jgi:hypothetical protein
MVLKAEIKQALLGIAITNTAYELQFSNNALSKIIINQNGRPAEILCETYT